MASVASKGVASYTGNVHDLETVHVPGRVFFMKNRKHKNVSFLVHTHYSVSHFKFTVFSNCFRVFLFNVYFGAIGERTCFGLCVMFFCLQEC